ncbi:MAG TPA: DEAD/DEAH box helicase [Nocardioidaceae bacterium]|nr:DEAD/DEAH box helicase [Nocardioidaceae bacterium]
MAHRRNRSTSARPATAGASTPPPSEGFAALGVPRTLVEALTGAGIHEPFPIQSATLPDSLSGRDVLGRGRTGSGKTLAFALPVVARLAERPARPRPERPRALILAPTRELVSQIDAALAPLAKACGLTTMTIFGGVKPGPQINKLARGVDIAIACPGRLEDHLRSGHVDLGGVEVAVLDEADHMADLGFLPGVRRLLDRTPGDGQRLLFSATLDAGVDVIVKRYLHDPVTHSVDSPRSTISTMTHHVLHVAKQSRLPVLADLAAAPGRTLVFTRTKHGAKSLARQLNANGVPAVELHGNLSQGARTRALAAFSNGTAATLVATDIAARGIHVDDITLVVHADPPVEHKAYLHRSGRTARAGAAGTVVTLMLDAQVSDVRALTRRAGIKPTVTRVDVSDPLLAKIAPGERVYVEPATLTTTPAATERGGRGQRGSGPRRPRRSGSGSGNPRRSGGSSRKRPSHSAAGFSTGARRGR